MARELLLALQVTTQYSVDDYDLAPIIARCLIMPYILPALTTPESQGIISTNITALPRQNLQEVGKLVEAIATGRYRVPSYDVNMFATLEGYILDATPAFSDWILTRFAWTPAVASVDDVESHLNTQELVEKSVEPKPITMTRAEIYAIHRTLMREEDAIIVSESDAMRGILKELDGVPNVLYQEGQSAPVTFALSNRFAKVIDDPLAAGKADWAQAKRHILAVLRVQTGKTIIDILTAPVSEEDEWIWQDVVQQDLHRDQARKRKSQLPPVPNQGSDYRLDDITSLPFREVKARAIQYCMKLEKQGLLDRNDDWQGLLDDIAGDIRSKNKNRQRRKKDYAAMSIAFTNSTEKKATLEEQIASYNKYIGSAMDTMQKQGKKRFVWPFSKQHRHLRSMQKAGKAAKFGSFKYSAADLYEKHILLPSQGFSPKQFEKLFVILSSNEVGVFTMEIVDPSLNSKSQVLDSCEIRMEDLLQAKFENKGTLDLFDQVAKVRVNTLIFLINRSK
ncbi:hypothetical protein QFC19_001288 [Naganishia cerealis]|uniref:Uncharacterized protein n=1 Tax=Naganishia cerealis TaxID=610337 RepID=A0ACC2WIS5_9TREE|nr:hypothetical protein QFC19_001288 [Naganishia cerealis]